MPQASALLPRLLDSVRRFFASAMTLLMPVDCAGCATPDTRWCERCASTLDRELLPPEARLRPVNAPIPVFAATEYSGLARDAIVQFKEQGRTDLKYQLASALQLAVNAARAVQPEVTLYCVPIPSRAGSAGARGYQHVQLMVRALPNRPAANNWLRASATRRDQVGLGAAQRQRNAKHSFVVSRRVRRADALNGKHVLLIDDIATTGSTLSAAAAALEAAGARVVAAAVFAQTIKRTA